MNQPSLREALEDRARGCRVHGLGFRVRGLRFRVQGLGVRLQGFRVQGIVSRL